ncbi:MAG: hypothetical protein B6242_10995 [Anaerolineaceae bacterium 4572_78]|nr:MAG: hypothetical protein B6242_10995 [Anaerolineaceae bacterium 4572_78]
MGDELQIQTEYIDEGTLVMHLAGDLTHLAKVTVNETFEDIEKMGLKNIILNFRENDYINSAGIALIFRIAIQSKQQDHQLAIAMPNRHYQKIFRQAGLKLYAQIYESFDEAKEQMLN